MDQDFKKRDKRSHNAEFVALRSFEERLDLGEKGRVLLDVVDQWACVQARLSIPRRAVPAQVLIDIDALPDAFAQALKLQQAPAGMEVHFATQAPNELGNETQLAGGTEGLHRSLCLVVTRVRQVAHPHDQTIPLCVAGTPILRG
jgi:hypothetical protein